jgi:hypothetical protein
MKRKKERSYWVQNWLQKWDILSHMSLIRELCLSSEDDLKNYLIISDECFRVLLNFTPNSFLYCRWIKRFIIT